MRFSHLFISKRSFFSHYHVSLREPKKKERENIQRGTKFADNLVKFISLKSLYPACAYFPINDSKDQFPDCMEYFKKTCHSDLWMPGWLLQFIGQLGGKQPLFTSAGGTFWEVLIGDFAYIVISAHPVSAQDKVVPHGLFWLTWVVLKV